MLKRVGLHENLENPVHFASAKHDSPAGEVNE